jgi:hypothetical protein
MFDDQFPILMLWRRAAGGLSAFLAEVVQDLRLADRAGGLRLMSVSIVITGE